MSPRAAARLASLGFTKVYDYVAGKADWGSAGLPLEGENGSATMCRPAGSMSAPPTYGGASKAPAGTAASCSTLTGSSSEDWDEPRCAAARTYRWRKR